jgi:2-iminobutanoate/2-iminopropanoate deaminase
MNRSHTPAGIAPPFRNIYSHGMTVPEGSELLFVSGQLGLRPDGSIAADLAGQAEQVMLNIKAILADAGMGMGDLVKLNAYLVKAEDIAAFAPIRATHLDGAKPAMTTVVVTALAQPGWLLEVEAVAAKSA